MSKPASEPFHLSSSSPPSVARRRTACLKRSVLSELKTQLRIGIPLVPMNSTWFAKTAITTAFLGRLGELHLAAGALGITFANVTGFSVLNGLCWAMEPICGQAHGADNRRLLHKTLLMTTILLLLTCIPVAFIWVNVDRILLFFGQERDISLLAKSYVMYLLPDLMATSFLSPLKTYLSSQGNTLPTMLSSGVATALHIPYNILLSKKMGFRGVALAAGLTDATAATILASYVILTEERIREGWRAQRVSDWARLLSLSTQCCLTGCLEWWCYEILVLLAGRMRDARRTVSVLSMVLNFDYLFYGVLASLATCASTRVANELGTGSSWAARNAARVSLCASAVTGLGCGLAMVALKGQWGYLFSHDEGVVDGARKTLMVMAVVEVFNIPLGTCGGIVRGTSRPWLGMFSVGGFYFVGLPLSIVLAFKLELGLSGLLLGFAVGCATSTALLCVLIARIDWDGEAMLAKNSSAATAAAAGGGLDRDEESLDCGT
ncbi:protein DETOXIFICATION 56 [Iris pallida]|uniref:Protein DETOXIFICATION n=1 Tax=Iris pallida TaxID=29817 RepID=A0AAX6EKV4_IRIPA|nr:protein DETOXIFICATION 56 [Iris pallida]